MEKIGRGKRASENQKEFLINFLEENIDIANDKLVTTDGAKFRDEKWKELATRLNALGGTLKDGAKWRKYWSDLRVHTRAKYIGIKQAEQRSGINGLSKVKPLSALEERVIKISTIEAVDGDETPEVGFGEIPALLDQSRDISEEVTEVLSDSYTTYIEPLIEAEYPACSSQEPNATSSAKIRGNTPGRRRRQKRKPQPETPHLEKLFKLEEKKLAEMETANNLKRQQIDLQRNQLEATIKQTNAIIASTLAKENLLAKLNTMVDILQKKN